MFLTVFTRFSVHSGRTGAPLGRSWGALGPFLAPLRLSWDGLGRSWGGLGPPLEGSCGHLGPVLQKISKKAKKIRKKSEILNQLGKQNEGRNH